MSELSWLYDAINTKEALIATPSAKALEGARMANKQLMTWANSMVENLLDAEITDDGALKIATGIKDTVNLYCTLIDNNLSFSKVDLEQLSSHVFILFRKVVTLNEQLDSLDKDSRRLYIDSIRYQYQFSQLVNALSLECGKIYREEKLKQAKGNLRDAIHRNKKAVIFVSMLVIWVAASLCYAAWRLILFVIGLM